MYTCQECTIISIKVFAHQFLMQDYDVQYGDVIGSLEEFVHEFIFK